MRKARILRDASLGHVLFLLRAEQRIYIRSAVPIVCDTTVRGSRTATVSVQQAIPCGCSAKTIRLSRLPFFDFDTSDGKIRDQNASGSNSHTLLDFDCRHAG